jgi:hypothetical protein
MTIIVLVYILLLIVFLVISSLILRHTVKFGYLSPSFKIVVAIFGVLALCVIVFSIYLMFQINKPASSSYEYPITPTQPAVTGDLNF